MNKVIALLLSLTLAFNALFAYTPVTVFADEEESSEEVFEVQSEESAQDPELNEETVIETEETFTDSDQITEDEIADELLENETDNEETPTELIVTVEENDTGDLVVKANMPEWLDTFAKGSGKDENNNDHHWGYFELKRDSDPNLTHIYYPQSSEIVLSDDRTFLTISNSFIIDKHIENGEYTLILLAEGFDEVMVEHFVFTRGIKQGPAADEIRIEYVNDELVISSSDTKWLEAVAKYTTSTKVGDKKTVYDDGGSMLFSSYDSSAEKYHSAYCHNTRTIVDGQIIEDVNEVRYSDGKIYFDTDLFMAKRLPSGVYNIDCNAQGYSITTIENVSIETPVKKVLPEKIDVHYEADSGLYIESNDKNWLAGIAANDGADHIEFFFNELVDGYPNSYYVGIYSNTDAYRCIDFDGERIFISNQNLTNYCQLPKGDYTFKITANGYAPNYVTSETIHFDGVTLDESEIKARQDKNGDLLIESDEECLRSLTIDSEINADGTFKEVGSRVIIIGQDVITGNAIKKTKGNDSSMFINTSEEKKIEYDGKTALIKGKTLLENGLDSGTYSIIVIPYGFGAVSQTDLKLDLDNITDTHGVRVEIVNGDLVITADDNEWLKALAVFAEEFVYESSKNKEGGTIRFFSVDENHDPDGRYNTTIGNKIVDEAGFKDEKEYYHLSEDGTKLIIPKTTISIYDLITGTYGIEFNALGYDPVTIYQDIETFVIDENIEATVEFNKDEGLILTSDNKKWLDGLTEVESNSVFDSYIYLYNNETGSGKFNGRFDNRFHELVRKDERTVVIPADTMIESRGFETDDYTVKIKAYGYTTYIYPQTVHVTGAQEAPEDVDFKVDEKGNLVVTSQSEDFLKNLVRETVRDEDGRTVKAGGSINIHFSDMPSPAVYTPGVNWFTFANEDGKTQLVYDENEKKVIISKEILKAAGVQSETYDVAVHAYAYKTKNFDRVAINVDRYEYTITFNANGGTGRMEKQTAVSGVDTKLNENQFTKKSYRFAGWSTKNSGEPEYEDEGIINKVFEKEKQNITLYAIWTPIKVEKITITGPEEVAAGKSVKLVASAEPTDAVNKNVLWTVEKAEYTDSQGVEHVIETAAELKNYATVSGGTLVAKKVGQITKITVVAEAKDGSGVEARHVVTIVPAVETVSIFHNGEDVSKKTIGVDPSKTKTVELSAMTYPEDASKKVTWTSSNTKSATVDENGLVTIVDGVTKATVKITAKASDGTNKNTVVTINIAKLVEKITVYSVNDPVNAEGKHYYVSGNAHIATGQSLKLMTDVSPEDAVNKNVTWTSSDVNVATVSSGTVNAKSVDQMTLVTISATAKDGSGVSGTYRAFIHPRATSVMLLNDFDEELTADEKIGINQSAGSCYKLYAKALSEDAIQKFTWTSSNKKIAEVDDYGFVTFTGVKGTVKITAAAKDGSGKKASVSFYHVDNTSVTISGIYKYYPLEVEEGYQGSLQLNARNQNYDIITENISWSSSNEDVAMVDSNGLVTFMGASGVVRIAVFSKDHSASDSIEITVKKSTDRITKLALGDLESVTEKYHAKEEYFGENWQEFTYESEKYGTIHISNGTALQVELFDMWRIPQISEIRDADVRFWHYIQRNYENLDYFYSSMLPDHPAFGIEVRPEYNEIYFDSYALIRTDKQGNIVMRCFDPNDNFLTRDTRKNMFLNFENELLGIYDLSINDFIDIDTLYQVLEGK